MNFSKQFSLTKPEGRQQGVAAANAGPSPATPQLIVGGPGGPAVIQQGPAGPATPGPKLTFQINVQNPLNNTQNRGYVGVLGSPLFGKSTGTAAGRTIIAGSVRAVQRRLAAQRQLSQGRPQRIFRLYPTFPTGISCGMIDLIGVVRSFIECEGRWESAQ